jgi:hypothetical protein
MRCLIVVVLVVACLFNSFAQSHSIGLFSGISIANISAQKVFNDGDNRESLVAGVKFDWNKSNKLHFGADLLYNKLGFEEEFMHTNNYGGPTGEFDYLVFNYNYISAPLKFGYVFGKKLQIVPKVGLQPSFLIKAETVQYKTFNWSSYSTRQVYDVRDRVSKFDLAGLIELELRFLLIEKLNLFTCIAGKYSITPFSNSEYFNDFYMRHKVLLMSLGLSYTL